MKSQQKKTAQPKENLTREMLMAELQLQNKKDVEACEIEINKAIAPILEKYGCELTSTGQWLGAQFQQSVAIIKTK